MMSADAKDAQELQTATREANFREGIFIASEASHAPGLYWKVYPPEHDMGYLTDEEVATEVDFVVPQNEEDFMAMMEEIGEIPAPLS